MSNEYFQFRQFRVWQRHAAMKVGTDGVLLGSWDMLGGSPRRILDIGTGTGVVALMMAQRFAGAEVTAIDVDDNAVADAAVNFSESPYADSICLEHTSLQDFVGSKGAERGYDLIVCNPPYFDSSLENPDASKAKARHTSSLPFSVLAASVVRLLADGGRFAVILPTESVRLFTVETAIAGLVLSAHYAIKTVPRKAPRRHLLLFGKENDAEYTKTTVCLMEPDGSRSEWYSRVMKDFYL